MENIRLSKIINTSTLLSVIGIIFLVFISPFLLSLAIKYIPYGFQPSLFAPEKIDSGKVFKQEIISKMDGFSGVGLSIKNPNYYNKGNIALSVYEDGTLVRKVEVSGTVIPDGDLVKFIFPRIEGSDEKRYFLVFETNEKESVESFAIYTTDENTEWSESFYVNFEKRDTPLALVTYYNLKEKTELGMLIYKGWAEKIYFDKGFLFFYLMVLILSIFGYLYRKTPK